MHFGKKIVDICMLHVSMVFSENMCNNTRSEYAACGRGGAPEKRKNNPVFVILFFIV